RDLSVSAGARQVDLAGDALALGRRVGCVAQQQRLPRRPGFESPPERIVARPVDGGAQLAAAPGQPHAARRNALQCALQAPDGTIDPPRFPHGPQHARPYPAARPLPLWTASAMTARPTLPSP